MGVDACQSRGDATTATPRNLRQASATKRFEEMPEDKRKAVEQCIIAGLPGRMVEAYTLPQFQAQLDAYADIDADGLRANLKYFLQAVVPVAAEVRRLDRATRRQTQPRAHHPACATRTTEVIVPTTAVTRP